MTPHELQQRQYCHNRSRFRALFTTSSKLMCWWHSWLWYQTPAADFIFASSACWQIHLCCIWNEEWEWLLNEGWVDLAYLLSCTWCSEVKTASSLALLFEAQIQKQSSCTVQHTHVSTVTNFQSERTVVAYSSNLCVCLCVSHIILIISSN